MATPLHDKVALVTGASRGLGLEIACRLARDGAHVALAARDANALDSAATRVAQESSSGARPRVRTYATDLASELGADDLVDTVLRDFGRIDVLVNNAAIQGPIGPFEQTDWNAWKQVFDVNLLAPARLIHRVIPVMRTTGRGKIINLSGGGAANARAHFSAYGASKCALVRLTETLAHELRPDRIDVNAIAPGAMNTRMTDEVLAAGPDRAPIEYEAALKRSREGGAPPDRAVALVAWLASSASDGISGKLISAVWDKWESFAEQREELIRSELYTLRRVVE